MGHGRVPLRRRRAPADGPRDRRRSSRRARPCRRGCRPRSTCCKASCALPSTNRRSPGPHIRWHSRRRHWCRSCAISARMMSLTATPGRSAPLSLTRMRLLLALAQRLRCEYAFTLARADAEGDGAEGAVRRGMAVAADQRHARQGEAEFRPDDVHDAVPIVLHSDVVDAETLAVGPQPRDLPRWPDRRAAAGAAAASEPHGRRPPYGWRDDAICGLRRSIRQTPGGWRPPARDAGRYRAARCRRHRS